MIIPYSTSPSTVTFHKTTDHTEVVFGEINFIVFNKPLTGNLLEVAAPGSHLIMLDPVTVRSSVAISAAHFIALAAISAGEDVTVQANGRVIIANSVKADRNVKVTANSDVYIGRIERREEIVGLFKQAIENQNGPLFIEACLSLSDLPNSPALPQASQEAIEPPPENG